MRTVLAAPKKVLYPVSDSCFNCARQQQKAGTLSEYASPAFSGKVEKLVRSGHSDLQVVLGLREGSALGETEPFFCPAEWAGKDMMSASPAITVKLNDSEVCDYLQTAFPISPRKAKELLRAECNWPRRNPRVMSRSEAESDWVVLSAFGDLSDAPECFAAALSAFLGPED